MTSKDTQDPTIKTNTASMTTDASTNAACMTIAGLIDAQVTFVQQWLHQHAEPLLDDAWQWLGTQQLSRYVSASDVQYVLNDWLLAQPMSDAIRADIRDILHTVIYHPVNDDVPLSELIDDTQVDILATYIGSHSNQRNALIHTLIGNETFADLLTQTLYHAINDFMESTLDKAGGVGKLMKLGRSSFEKATNKNLDDKLQAYLHRNIKDLTQKAEVNAQAHLSNDEVARLLITGWARLKDQPVSELQTYLNDDPDNGSIAHIEASMQHSYNRLRSAPYLHTLANAAAQVWYDNHQSDTIAVMAAGLGLNDAAMQQLSHHLRPIIYDAINSTWLSNHLHDMLQAFYAQSDFKHGLTVSHR